MKTSPTGRVVVAAKVENLHDLEQVETGVLRPDQVRTIEVDDAFIDPRSTMLAMPRRLIGRLGLRPGRRAPMVAGNADALVYGIVRLTVQGRDCNVEVLEVPDEGPVIIGLVPLTLLDFVIDPAGQRLIGNPAHGGEQMIELF